MGIASSLLKVEHVGIRNLKTNLSRFLNEEKPYVITDHGKPKQVIIPYGEMMELVDMFDELSDPGLLETIREGRVSIERGERGIPVANLWKEIEV
ncbi:MAG: type II toxin-antitoxin system Phd/YefM family antitoxin [Candidatus Desantisbacteria bacterium]